MTMSNPNVKYRIKLSQEQRQELIEISKNGNKAAKQVNHAQVLLMSDDNAVAGRWRDEDISQALNMHVNTIAAIRKKYALDGIKPALQRKPRETPPISPKLDGHQEAHLIAICCSEPPAGRVRWTMQLLAKELVARKLIVAISRETIRNKLNHIELQPWKTERLCIPEEDLARFIAQMEDVLDVYSEPPDPNAPLIWMDEASVELTGDLYPSIPAKPGQTRKEDYHYQRNGVEAIFMFVDPINGWRRVSNRPQRTRLDWAEEIKQLLDEDYPEAPMIKLVCDNLNTHHVGSLYHAFPAETAHRLARRLSIHYTPRNGSWLNIADAPRSGSPTMWAHQAAETELSVLSQQCLDRRISRADLLKAELAAWQQERNQEHSKVKWQFTTADARIKLHHLYPQF
jgi:transposase